MPICIECRYPVNQLYSTYSKADDRSLGKGVRLTQCPRCKRFADKYVEHDFVVLFIDLVLIKPQVYRHLLFNRLGREDDRLDPSIIRLGILLLLFDVYLTWARIEKQSPIVPPAGAAPTPSSYETPEAAAAAAAAAATTVPFLAEQSIVLQYLFFLFLCLTEFLTFHFTIRLLSTYVLRYLRPNSVSTALLVSSCTKLFPILMVIWEYDIPAAAKSVGWAVVVNNIEALKILLDCGYLIAAGLTAAGAASRLLVGWTILRAAGLDGVGMGSFMGWRSFAALWSNIKNWEDLATRIGLG
ncbi:Arv1-like protein [Xylona heveae TC161]|uniref:Protein ARV n=1 Tax=Xylona heveae (strain CBS 132557 / TC161) TaxID=1328760 RepID=A0A165IU25_XYLHT|nr:Arv1-like protein [Xylona heveae TC161]KZF25392.1 Arv1-like protein [Xylona heveae TC161]